MAVDHRQPTAAVTGASRGIGRAVAWELARGGYRVFALARSAPELETLVSGAAARGWTIEQVQMDVADDASRERAVAAIMAATDGYGLDVLVNNAGYGQLGPLEELPIDKFRRQLEVNVIGVLAFTQPFLAGMRSRRRGRIVNVSSAAGRISTPFMGAYSASKFALEGMSDALRVELSPFDVHVVLIEPGPIRTNFGSASEGVAEERVGSPYAPYLLRWRRARAGNNLFSRSPEGVARVIARAVRSGRPRPRYSLTVPGRLGAVARRVAPDAVVDWALRRAIGARRRDGSG
jgi:short-subunit dehydrogenase